MSDIRAQITEIAHRLAPLCRHTSVRDDERGPFILAIAEDDIHSLELWYQDGEFSVELWHGQATREEHVVEVSKFSDAASATVRASTWLQSNAI